VLRRIFERKRDEMIGGWRILHNEEIENMYALPIINIIKPIKSSRSQWEGEFSTHEGEEKRI
jgi:hypothetical protein